MLKGMENKREQEEGQGFDAESFVFFLSIRFSRVPSLWSTTAAVWRAAKMPPCRNDPPLVEGPPFHRYNHTREKEERS